MVREQRGKKDKYHIENSIVASLATIDWTLVPKMKHPVF